MHGGRRLRLSFLIIDLGLGIGDLRFGIDLWEDNECITFNPSYHIMMILGLR